MKKLLLFLLIVGGITLGTSFTFAQQDPLAIGVNNMNSAQTFRDQENSATNANRSAIQQNLFGEMTNQHTSTISHARDSIMQSKIKLNSALRLLQSANHRFIHP